MFRFGEPTYLYLLLLLPFLAAFYLYSNIYADTDKNDSERLDMEKRVDSILRKHNNVNMYLDRKSVV